MTDHLSVRVRHHDSARSVLYLDGELDLASVSRLSSAVDAAVAGPGRHITLDALGVTFCDAAGLRGLLVAQRRLTEVGRTMDVAHIHGVLGRMLDLTDLRQAFQIATPV
ncbi:STAS domain-containing protein [Spongiactinospora sp. TRM90649]|uniref:STAS domain-containing protein n=1 Tax=Spongiactinospora sp. TRM90649 TaxID=3031114 RepID=UPI0023FA474E|nr:STAS domain-containing protein [Spongiactinospora sp. TRM90649]MDF5754386.1 STAS domain-containing protein [Spongiactinospora sp. TRM90649]